MSRLNELIQELCPNGVEYKELPSVLKIKNGSDYKFPPRNLRQDLAVFQKLRHSDIEVRTVPS